MKNNNDTYDIFLSYRREGGFETAKHLFDLLARDGYRVSFDIDTLRSGDFDTELLRRIDWCTDFILILNKGAFDRSIDPTFDRNKDWLRIELAYALEKGKNVIPVMLSGFTDFPGNLPADIAMVERKNGPKYDKDYVDAFYNKLLRFLDCKPVLPAESAGRQEAPDAAVKIETDLACRIFVDGEDRGMAQPGEATRLSLRGGSYRLRFESMENPADCIEDKNYRIDKDTEEWYTVVLLPVKSKREEEERRKELTKKKALEEQKRKKEEAKRQQKEKEAREIRERYLLQLPDERFESCVDGFYDTQTGELLIPKNWDFILWGFHEGLVRVEKSERYGYIDKTGKEVIPYIYDFADSFHEGLAAVKKNGKWGYINKMGEMVIPRIYDHADSFHEGLAKVEKNGKYGYIDKMGKEVIPCIYDSIYPRDGLALVKRGGKYGYIDRMGKEVIPCVYDSEYSRDGLIWLLKGGKWGSVDKMGKEITPFIYDFIDTVVSWNDLTTVKKNGKYGFADEKGKEVTPCIYDNVDNFYEGFASVKRGGKWGYIDKTGKEVIPCIYDEAEPFRGSSAYVVKSELFGLKKKYGYIDKSGKWVKDK